SAGYPLTEIQRRLKASGVSGVEITNAVVGNTANAVKFRYASQEGWMVVSSQAISIPPPYKTIETFSLGREHYSVIDAPGGSGGSTPPPIPPRTTGTLPPNPNDPIYIPVDARRRAQLIIPLARKIKEYQDTIRKGNLQTGALISFYVPEGSDRLYRQI